MIRRAALLTGRAFHADKWSRALHVRIVSGEEDTMSQGSARQGKKTTVMFVPLRAEERNKTSSKDDEEKSKEVADMQNFRNQLQTMGLGADFLDSKVVSGDLETSLGSLGGCEVLRFPETEHRVLAVGLGKQREDTGAAWVEATAAAVKKLRSMKLREAAFQTPGNFAPLVTRGIHLANWAFDRHLTGERQPVRLEHVDLCIQGDYTVEDERRSELESAIALGTLRARDLANARPDDMHPGTLEEVAKEIAEDAGMDIRVLSTSELEKFGLNMHVAVGKAASEDKSPRLVALELNVLKNSGKNKKTRTAVFVGKGITFDTGGLNLKPTGFIEGMHLDMGGCAAVLGAAGAIGNAMKTGLVIRRDPTYHRIVFVIALAENSIGPDSYKPHSILRSHKGLSVEVGNTDAEGRLLLADAISWAQDTYEPSTVIDLATLTGACIVALGEYGAGLFARDARDGESIAATLVEAGRRRGERLHPMPIWDEHRDELKTDHADLSSTGVGRYGGASTAAAFLENFVNEGVSWAHIDIAGPAMASKELRHGVIPKGGTGFGAATIVQYILHHIAEDSQR